MDREFFDIRMLYYGLDEFYEKRVLIKSVFMLQDLKTQYLYRYYVYSRAFIDDNFKNSIWEYLQDDLSDLEFRLQYVEWKRKKKKH